jgi:prepilin-type N-terminal cleavage/methylation domain-containing protein
MNAMPRRDARGRDSGFSMLEMVLTVAIVLILAAIALPDFTRAYRIYQLNSSASRLAGLLKLTRFEAIRRNTQVSFQVQQNGGNWLAWCDTIANGLADTTEMQDPIIAPISLLPPGGPPSPDAITAALGGGAALTAISGNMAIPFDPRGAVVFAPAPPAIYVFYLGNTTYPDYGYRAVVLLQSGMTQVWSAPVGGPWNRIS